MKLFWGVLCLVASVAAFMAAILLTIRGHGLTDYCASLGAFAFAWNWSELAGEKLK